MVEEIPLDTPPTVSLPGEEETQSLPVEEIQGWRSRNGSLEGLPKGRETLDLFFEFSLLLLKDQPPERLMEDMLSRLFAFLEAEHGAILLPDQAGELTLFAARTQETTGMPPPRFSSETVKNALARREAVLLLEPAPGPAPGTGSATGIATTSAMAVPLEYAGEVLGLFYFDAGRLRPPFMEDELRLVASLGNLVAARIIQQRLAEELRLKQDREQEFIVIEAAAQAKGEFLAHMSHEMRTPMHAVLGFLYLAKGEELSPLVLDYLGKMEQTGLALMELLDEVLDLAKIEARKLDLESRPFRLEAVLREVTDLFGPAALKKGLPLNVHQDEGASALLLGDAPRLRQVLLNLVGNALKFTERGGIQVEVAPLESLQGNLLLRFSVEDTGIGMSAAQLGKLFTPFTQADPGTSRTFGGTGLGLAISKRLVELMGGEIWVESSPGAGSRFLFTARFPLAPEQSEPPSTQQPLDQPDWRSALSGLRVLVIEDHAISLDLLSILLKQVGIQVSLASHGAEAMDLVRDSEFDAILMDLEMPDMDGFQATALIRSGERNCDCPIIALTAHALASHQARCLAGGLNDCLTKPIAPAVLYAALNRWAGARRAAATLVPANEPEAGGDLPANLEGLSSLVNIPLALGRLDGHRDLLVKFLHAFAADPGDIEGIRSALSRGDWTRAASLAHGIKGISDTLAISGVAQAARELEHQLQDPAGDGWVAAWAELEKTLEAFRACIRALG